MTFKAHPSLLEDKFEKDRPLIKSHRRWPVNTITGHQEPPDLDWIISRLVKIRSSNCTDGDLYKSAVSIHFIWRMLRLYGRLIYWGGCLAWVLRRRQR